MTPRILIIGPCAAETREQVLTTAQRLKDRLAGNCQAIFRAGLWKPRSSPDTFQGVGDEGLAWLQDVQRKTGMKVATEVSNTEQAEAALKAGVNYLWIGARTAANPIQVQLLADTIRDRAEGVMIKNPVSEDAELWIGNIRRIMRYTPNVMAVHRGCNHLSCWGMAKRIREALAEVPLILDPSHMAGRADKVESLMQAAARLEYDGYMIEVHPHPTEALSDAKQQITPEELSALLERLEKLPKDTTETELLWYRAMMDEVDDRLWDTLAERMQISRKIGRWKKERGLPVVQPERKAEIIEKRLSWAKTAGVQPDTVRNIIEAIHTESVREQGK